MGRNSYWPLKWGASSLVAFDYDKRSVASTKETLKQFANSTVVYKSIFKIDWKDEFDVAFSIGVIHHLEDPREALRRMVSALKQGGTLVVWVYSYEGNEWIVRYVDPVRIHITSKLPPGFLHALSYACSIPLYLCAKIFKGPGSYMAQLATFNLRHIHGIVFDQLLPDIAHYWKRDEVLSLVAGLPLYGLKVEMPPNRSGWILTATKK